MMARKYSAELKPQFAIYRTKTGEELELISKAEDENEEVFILKDPKTGAQCIHSADAVSLVESYGEEVGGGVLPLASVDDEMYSESSSETDLETDDLLDRVRPLKALPMDSWSSRTSFTKQLELRPPHPKSYVRWKQRKLGIEVPKEVGTSTEQSCEEEPELKEEHSLETLKQQKVVKHNAFVNGKATFKKPCLRKQDTLVMLQKSKAVAANPFLANDSKKPKRRRHRTKA